MTQLTKENITNLYLYGTLSTPNNLVDSGLIRPAANNIRESNDPSIEVEVPEFMVTGGGRFAIPSQFDLIRKFFNLNIVTQPMLPPINVPIPIPPNPIDPDTGELIPYDKFQINDLINDGQFFGWDMQQFNYDDSSLEGGIDDFLDRVWVYNSMVFKISDGAEFFVDDEDNRWIKNLAIEPLINPNENLRENFDFASDDLGTTFANSLVLPSIDPSGIGRRVWIDFVDADLLPRIERYDQSDFEQDRLKNEQWEIPTAAGFAKINSLKDEFLSNLFDDGIIRFLDGNKPILYGTLGADNMSVVQDVTTGGTPTLHEFKDNGAILVAGEGADILRGSLYDDILMGDEGNDKLYGQPFLTDATKGSDIFEGGVGNDAINGSKGNQDVAVFSDDYVNNDESLNYSIETVKSEFAGIVETITTISHIAGTQTDGIDTLEDIEFARFKDTILPIPLKDGVENTVSIEIPSTETNINPNDPPTPTHLALASPISMLDGDVEYTVNYSIIPQDTQYNIAFIIDTSNSMETAELQATKDAYINLTNYFIDNEIAENSNFAVINFSRYATLNANLTADEAIATIQGLTASTNAIEGTKYTDALDKAFQFFTQSPLNLSKLGNIAFFTSDGKSQHNFADPNDVSYVYNAAFLRSVANVQAFGIDDGTNGAGAVTQSQLDFVDSDNGVIVSEALKLSEAFSKSGLIDNIDTIDILKDGQVIQTIQANELTDSPLGVSFEGTIDELDVSLGAENIITAQASFVDGTSSPGSDFIVASGLTPSDVDPLTNIANGSPEDDELALNPLDLGAEGGSGDDSIIGNKYSNILNGGEGNDTILGHEGDDTITPGNGRDRVNGGDGIDTVVYEDQLLAATVFSQAGKITNVDGTDTLTNIEFIQFSDFRISAETLEIVPILSGSNITVIEGNSENSVAQFTLNLDTPAPVDVLFDYTTVDGDAIAGEDYLATSGQITIAAGETNATVAVEVIADTVFELDETFGLNLSNISGATFADNATEYTLLANIENDDIEPPAPTSCNPTTGDDDLTDCATTGDDTINGLAGNDTIVGLGGHDSLNGQANNDSLNGGNGNDTLIGSNGDDTLIGAGGDDSLTGSNDNDSLVGSNGNDTLNGGNGADILLGQNDEDRLIGSNGRDTLNGGNGADILFGQNDDDVLNGGGGNDILNGGIGADSLFGQNDDDRLVGNDGNDTLNGGTGNDSLFGQNNDDKLVGSDGNDTLNGGTGNDSLFGQNDDDKLVGGLGLDSLTGGAGNDRFVLVSGVTADRDIIQDYQDGFDLLDLTGGLTFGNLTINQNEANTEIIETATNETLATLIGIDAVTIDSSDFV